MTHVDTCFTDLEYHPYYCGLRLVRAGIGSAAGLAACIALVLAGNFAYLGPAIQDRAAALAIALNVAAAAAPVAAVQVVRAPDDPPVAIIVSN